MQIGFFKIWFGPEQASWHLKMLFGHEGSHFFHGQSKKYLKHPICVKKKIQYNYYNFEKKKGW